MKFNYQLIIEYDGTNFVGWQIQKNGISVQETVEKALKKYFKKKIKVIGSGRTDAGVHAKNQSANFLLSVRIKNLKSFIESINFFLKKKSISIINIKKRNINFHSRFSAKKRIYEYQITNRQGSLSIDKDRAWLIKKKIDIDLMKKGAKLLTGTHDFSTFRSSSCSAKSPIKTIKKINIKKHKEKISIIFESKSYLQSQIRSMVGCLKYLGTGKWSVKNFKEVLKLKDRNQCAPLAPPSGLYLVEIKY